MKFNGHFDLIDAHSSHHMLLLRNTTILENAETINIDILFESVKYIDIPTFFNGLTIEEGADDDKLFLKSKYFDGTVFDYCKIFVLESQGLKFYVIAVRCVITENSLGVGVTSIGFFKSYAKPTNTKSIKVW